MSTFWADPQTRDGLLNEWGTVVIDGKVFPGADSLDDPRACPCKPTGAKVAQRVDHQKIKGQAGHRLVIEGYQPEAFYLETLIWTKTQYDAYVALVPRINPKFYKPPTTQTTTKTVSAAQASNAFFQSLASRKSNTTVNGTQVTVKTPVPGTPPHTIEHPDLAVIGIDLIQFVEVPIPEWESTWGLRLVKLKVIEVYKGGKNVTQEAKSTDVNSTAVPIDPGFVINTGPSLP